MNSPCDTCNNRQRSLDPEGCFREYSTTDFVGRLCRKLFGCKGYYRIVRYD